ncbi:MAG: putative 2-succinyl-6-hydroxy-2,4-cyclohexadiene-1-carboxylate synthase [Acidimicrobiia bacterium]|nr:MAG: putative 2-succinyl-6-hydroxy-2,4-cyclohexadiene-1-carboxylate synthase [Acidimicrobiia bacterium]GIU91073.1 MAG: putative 2-succinyl-6-hydroxy-2,4-cyclohexadiene-1-carboxylate synthase [Acidimicrobiia bacterium]
MRVVFVPGFTQTASSWDGVVEVVRELHEVVALTVRVHATFEQTALALGDHGGAGVYVGYSMGARLCLRLALDRPEIVHGLVLVSGTAGITEPQERDARLAADEALARSVERDGVDAFLERWLAQPMFSSVPPDAPGLADRHALPAEYLAACLRRLGTGRMEPLWDRLGELRMPVALVTGRDDAKYDRLAGLMLERMGPQVVHVRLEGGHAVPLEQPAVLGGFVVSFVDRHFGSG